MPVTPDHLREILRLIGEDGSSLRGACRTVGAAYSVVSELLATDAWADRYARAKQDRGDHYGERVADVCRSVEDGSLDPNRARVAIDGYKWTAARMGHASWGDRTQVDARIQGDVRLDFTSLLGPVKRRRADDEGDGSGGEGDAAGRAAR